MWCKGHGQVPQRPNQSRLERRGKEGDTPVGVKRWHVCGSQSSMGRLSRVNYAGTICEA